MAANVDSWEDFKIQHGKDYATAEEESKRKAIFLANKKKVDEHNERHDKGETSYRLGINTHADWEAEEFYSIMNGYKKPEGERLGPTYMPSGVKVPDSEDWSKKGAVTGVKNQNPRNATGCLEGQQFMKTGNLVSLSEQNLIECSGMGVNGGDQGAAFEYIKKQGGIDTEDNYPYTVPYVCEQCQFPKGKVGATVSRYTYLPEGDESALKEAVATVGPIAVSINADNHFQHYYSGVYDDPDASNSKPLNHAVLVVGYGTLKGKDYWIVKNSWGDSWGQKGYILMSRNKDQGTISKQEEVHAP